ncbi:MAG: hypothetical protein WA014_01155 [Minisyncoccia bacterium]
MTAEKSGGIAKELGNLPIWAQIAGLLLTAIATIAAFWTIYLVYNPPIPQDVFAEAVNATSTVPLADVLSRASDFKTAYERANFLKTYQGKLVSGQGRYTNFFGENNYYLVIDFGTSWIRSWFKPYQIACSLKENDQNAKDTLMLLKQGQTLYFVGEFSDSNLNGYYYPVINNCVVLK